ncbi:MAG: hypothetical protein NVS9B15_21060 [Acidobacteriaceae bacterium]
MPEAVLEILGFCSLGFPGDNLQEGGCKRVGITAGGGCRASELHPVVEFMGERENSGAAFQAGARNRKTELRFPSLRGTDTHIQMFCNVLP